MMSLAGQRLRIRQRLGSATVQLQLRSCGLCELPLAALERHRLAERFARRMLRRTPRPDQPCFVLGTCKTRIAVNCAAQCLQSANVVGARCQDTSGKLGRLKQMTISQRLLANRLVGS